MSLQKCHECGKDVSSEAAACPNCGAKVKVIKAAKEKKPAGKLTYLLLGLLAITLVGTIATSKKTIPLTAEQQAAQQAANLEQTAADTKKKEAELNRYGVAVAAAASIKSSLRDPDSLKFESMRVNDDASVVCAEYRAKNGFGGMNREFVVFVKNFPSKSASVWNKHCKAASYDQLYAVE